MLFRILPGQNGWSLRNCFSWGWWLVLLSFGSFEISEESGVGTGPALAPLLPNMGHFFHTPHPPQSRDVLRLGKEGKEEREWASGQSTNPFSVGNWPPNLTIPLTRCSDIP